MKDKKFLFRNKEYIYGYDWLDEDTFTFCFGDGEFVDEDGDEYFILVEYHVKENKFIFEVWYEYEVIVANENYLTEIEKSNIKEFMYDFMK